MKEIKKSRRKTEKKRNLFKSIMNRLRDKRNKKRVKVHFHPRRLARRIAKAKMQRAGYRRINRNFAKEWLKHIL